MAHGFEKRVVELVTRVLGASIEPIPAPIWLIRPGKIECRSEWDRVCAIYNTLTDMYLPEVMRPQERRQVDAILLCSGSLPRILEVDEKQHFNSFRALTLEEYVDSCNVAFDPQVWIDQSKRKKSLEGGGFAKPKPPLFPGDNGRHRQRAFRDALCDLLPPVNGYAPTLRIGDFETKDWIFGTGAEERMDALLKERL